MTSKHVFYMVGAFGVIGLGLGLFGLISFGEGIFYLAIIGGSCLIIDALVQLKEIEVNRGHDS